MKIVHEFYYPTQTGGGWEPYGQAPGAPLPISGHVKEFLICSASGFAPEEALYIDGDFLVVHDALTSALSCLDTLAAMYVGDGRLAPDWRERKEEALRVMEERIQKAREATK